MLSRDGKSGLGSAYRDGFRWGLERGFEALVEMDSDLSHDPDALPSLVEPLEQGYEVCIGSRYVPGGSIPNWSLPRRLLSKGGNLYANVLLNLNVRDSTAGFRAYSATVLRRIDLSSVRADSYGFQIEMTYRAIGVGARVREVPIRFVDRELGTSKMSTYTVVEALALVTVWGARRASRRLWAGAKAARAAVRSRLPVTGGTAGPTDAPSLPIDAGTGPVVVLVHGQPGAGADWEVLAGLLAGEHRVLAPDRPGWGSDRRPAMGIAANADALEAALGAAAVEGAVTVVGHSFGGGVALELALRHPDRVGALVLIGSVGVGAALSGFDRLLTVPMLGSGILRAGTATLRRALIAATRYSEGHPGTRVAPEGRGGSHGPVRRDGRRPSRRR